MPAFSSEFNLLRECGVHHIPSQDNTRYAFLQMDDRALVYRGADQPDMSVINPESDVWQHIKVSSPDILRVSLNSSMADTSIISGNKLAYKIFGTQ